MAGNIIIGNYIGVFSGIIKMTPIKPKYDYYFTIPNKNLILTYESDLPDYRLVGNNLVLYYTGPTQVLSIDSNGHLIAETQ